LKNPQLLILLAASLSFSAFAENPETGPVLEYIAMEPHFIVNLQGARRSYLKTDIRLLVEGKESAETIKVHSPALRHSLIMLISEYSSGLLETAEQREEFRRKALQESRATLDQYASGKGLIDLFFTEFLVQ
jgi:flagellar protein FliL